MGIVVLSQVREEKRKRWEQTEKRWRRSRYRLLWISKVFIAKHQYSCDYCIGPILPGDEYTREVHANHYDFWIKRQHYPNCYGPTEEEWCEELERTERERETEERDAFQESA